MQQHYRKHINTGRQELDNNGTAIGTTTGQRCDNNGTMEGGPDDDRTTTGQWGDVMIAEQRHHDKNATSEGRRHDNNMVTRRQRENSVMTM